MKKILILVPFLLAFTPPNHPEQAPNEPLLHQLRPSRQPKLRSLIAKQGSAPLEFMQELNAGAAIDDWNKQGELSSSWLVARNYRALTVRFAKMLTPFEEMKKFSQYPLLNDIYHTHTLFNYLLNKEQKNLLLQAVKEDRAFQLPAELIKKFSNWQNIDGQSALMLAAANNSIAVMKVLLSLGADVTMQDRFGYNALAYASYRQHAQAVELLLTAKSPLFDANYLQQSAFFITLVNSNWQLAQRFYRLNVKNLNSQDSQGHTLLMYAALYGDLYQTQQLLFAGTQPKLRSQEDHSALDYAQQGLAMMKNHPRKGQYQRIIQLLESS